ncbi:hypothetical protein LCGC14_1239860, partial [marine sediment metagenome]
MYVKKNKITLQTFSRGGGWGVAHRLHRLHNNKAYASLDTRRMKMHDETRELSEEDRAKVYSPEALGKRKERKDRAKMA